jgi:hypothetical protein
MFLEIIVVLIFFGLAWYFLPSNSYIIGDEVDGGIELEQKVQRTTQFSYTCWIRIDNFNNYGKQKIIFVKGSADLDTACPALLIDGNTNTLMVKVDTFGAQETIPVNNVPANKWLHIALTVEEHEVNVYIDGVQYASLLSNIPKTNTGQLLISPDKGFPGKIAQLQFFPNVLSYETITSMSKNIPTVSEPNQVFPPYFDVSWFKS